MKSITEPVIILASTHEAKPFPPANGRSFTLAECQNAVGGLIEVVNLKGGDILIINEEGKLIEAAYNPVATRRAVKDSAIFPHDYIAGDAILCPSRMLE